jgi:hypothetical protein
MTTDNLDEKFEALLARDDDALLGSQFFEALAEIEQRRVQETIEVTAHMINGQVQFEPSDQIRAQGNELWMGDQRIVVKMAE